MKYVEWEERLLPSIEDNINTLRLSIPINGILYDIGANTGLLTLELLKVRPDIHCVLFEPVLEYYNFIEERFIGYDNVECYNYAVIDTERRLEMSVHHSNLGYNTLSEIDAYSNREMVNGDSLSNLIYKYKLPLPDVLKVDVEQSEYLFITGCKKLFNYHLPKLILMEIGLYPTHSLWKHEVDMIEYLFEKGYEKFDYMENNTTYDAKFILK